MGPLTRDRRIPPQTLRALLHWARSEYVAETPNLDHSQSHIDDDGAPTMGAQVRAYLALAGKDAREDNWLRIASKCDDDGFYRTPLRRAMETLPRERRLFLRDVVPELFHVTDIATLHGIPTWCANDVLYRSLTMLWQRYLDTPVPERNYLDLSESQRAAEGAA